MKHSTDTQRISSSCHGKTSKFGAQNLLLNTINHVTLHLFKVSLYSDAWKMSRWKLLRGSWLRHFLSSRKALVIWFPRGHLFIVSPWYLFLRCSFSCWQIDRRLRGDGEVHEGDVAAGTWKRRQLPCHLQATGRRAPAGGQSARWHYHHCAETPYPSHHLWHHRGASLSLRRGQNKGRGRNYM